MRILLIQYTAFIASLLTVWFAYLRLANVLELRLALKLEESEWRIRNWHQVVGLVDKARFYRDDALPSIWAMFWSLTPLWSYRKPVANYYTDARSKVAE